MSGRYVFDIETNGLLLDVTKIHCISVYDIDEGTSYTYSGKEVSSGLILLKDATELIGHNITGYDIPAIRKLYPKWRTYATLMDTLLLTCILHPDYGILSLEDWAIKLKIESKVQHEDWSTLSDEMIERCESDVRINFKVYERLINSPAYDKVKEPLNLEQQVALIHAQQVVTGVTFNVKKGIFLLGELDGRLHKRRELLIDTGPMTCMLPGIAKKNQRDVRSSKEQMISQGLVPSGTHKHLKADGTYTVATKKYFPDGEYLKVCGPYTKIEIKKLNPDSKEEVKDLLLTLGWVPTEWNRRKDKVTDEWRVTSPKLTEDSYASLPPGFGQTVAEYNMMSHRRNFLLNKKDKTKGALAAVYKRGDGRVTPDAFTCGTPTSRYRHSGTVCNIPRPSTVYGPEIRSLFRVPEGSLMVGIDLSGIEARMLAHYLLAGNYTRGRETADLILSPDKTNDFHSYNAKNWGVSRDIAKNTLYALMYGAGAKKLADTAGKPESMGKRLKKDFYKAHPGIKELIDDLERAYDKKGWIKGLDGRPLYVRSKMKLLNTLLQNAAAVVFKDWMVSIEKDRIDNWRTKKLIKQIIAYHDELQFEINGSEEIAKLWGWRCEEIATEVGKRLGIQVPINAEAKIGNNWKETH